MSEIAVILMQKNERYMLDAWIKYHSALVGDENIYIIDNGSDDIETKNILSKAESDGVHVEYKFNSKSDFANKGNIILNLIQDLQKYKPYDFYFPIDADELLACTQDGVISMDRRSIENVLIPYIGTKLVLRVGYLLDSNPLYNNKFRKAFQKKCFFYKNTAKKLDVGFHNGETFDGKDFIETDIVYVHYHFRSYEETMLRTKEKLIGRVGSLCREELESLKERKGPGHHLVNDILIGKDSYYERFENLGNYIQEDGIVSRLVSVGAFDAISSIMDYNIEKSRDRKEKKNLISGTVDSFQILGQNLVISGWALDTHKKAFKKFAFVVDGRKPEVVETASFTERPDVVRVYPGADLRCGFRLRIPIAQVSINAGSEIFVAPLDDEGKEFCRLGGKRKLPDMPNN